MAWLPTYFTDTLSLTLSQAAQVSLLPPIAAIVTSLLAGNSDLFARPHKRWSNTCSKITCSILHDEVTTFVHSDLKSSLWRQPQVQHA